MKAKKYIYCIILCLLLFSNIFFISKFIFFNSNKINTTYNTSTIIFVLDKVKVDGRNIISVRNKSYDNNYDLFDIIVLDENTWNLIQENTSYFVVYSFDKYNTRYLDQIELTLIK